MPVPEVRPKRLWFLMIPNRINALGLTRSPTMNQHHSDADRDRRRIGQGDRNLGGSGGRRGCCAVRLTPLDLAFRFPRTDTAKSVHPTHWTHQLPYNSAETGNRPPNGVARSKSDMR